MAISKVQDLGVAETENATTFAVPVGVTTTAGNTVIVRFCTNGVADISGIVDSRSNTYTEVGRHTPSSSVAGEVWMAQLTTALQSGDSITITYSSTIDKKAAIAEEWSPINLHSTISPTLGGNTTGTANLSVTPDDADQLVYGGVGATGVAGESYTEDTDTTNGSWTSLTQAGTTGGAAGANAKTYGAYKIVTASGAQTWNPTGQSRHWGGALAVFIEAGTAYDLAIDLDTPLAHWKFNEASGDFLDRKGTRTLTAAGGITYNQTGLLLNNDGDPAVTLNGSTGKATRSTGAASFTGTNFSVEGWVRRTGSAKATVINKQGASIQQYGLNMLAAGTWEWFLRDTTGVYRTITGSSWVADTTYHFVATYGSNMTRLYIDGVEVGTGAATVGQPDTAGDADPFQVGMEGTATNPFPGRVDEVAFYASTLTLAQVEDHYDIGSSVQADNTMKPGLPGWFHPQLVPKAWF